MRGLGACIFLLDREVEIENLRLKIVIGGGIIFRALLMNMEEILIK